jgi:membrane-associated phospholipid phosphatase
MNLTDRIYLGVHVALSVLVLARHEHVPHWPAYVAWNLAAILAIVLLARKQGDCRGWEFAHDWMPAAVFFTSVFEQTAWLSLALVPQWQSSNIIAFESALLGTVPALWLHQHMPSWSVEVLEFGYFAFYPLYPVVGLLLWTRRKRPEYQPAFRRMTDAAAVGYVACYATFLLWPTQSPRHAQGITGAASGGLFYGLVRLIQGNAGVHGNAFPSAHIMLAFIVLIFVRRYWPRASLWVLVINLLMCLGAVYDGYHYASDTVAGMILGLVVGWLFLPSE